MPYGYAYEDQPPHLAPFAQFNASGAPGSQVGGAQEGVASVSAENTILPGDWYRIGVIDGRQPVPGVNVGGITPTGNNLVQYNLGVAYGKQLKQYVGSVRNTG
jgi:hypothetical protein